MKTILCAAIALTLAGSLWGESDLDPADEFAWSWQLSAEQTERVWRLPLTPAIVESLHRLPGDDLLLTDADNHPVPFSRIPDDRLIETVTERRTLEARAAILDDDDQAASTDLELVLHHDGSRLSVRAPRSEARVDRQGRRVFEALIGAPADFTGLPRRRLLLELESEQPTRLDCWLRDADDDGPATRRVGFAESADTRPRRYRAELGMDNLPDAWHLACYGSQAPASLRLVLAELEGSRRIDHRQKLEVQPRVERDEEESALTFTLDGPYRVRSLRLESPEANLVSTIRVYSRSQPEQAWQRRGQLTLSTLDESTSALDWSEAHVVRDRHWRLIADPPLRQLPRVTIATYQEELAFLAQGRPPWRLYTGSRQGALKNAGTNWLERTGDQLPPAWTWPVITIGERSQAGGPAVLEPAPEPLPWQRYALWLVLATGALVVILLAIQLIRQPDRE